MSNPLIPGSRMARLAVGVVAVVFGSVALTGATAELRNNENSSIRVASAQDRRDSMVVTLDPTKRVEVKLVMKRGQRADYEWSTDGGEVAFNLHGEVPNDPSVRAHTYQRGASKGEKGNVIAVFDGVHGWSWRNTSDKPVKVTVKAWGQFSELKKM